MALTPRRTEELKRDPATGLRLLAVWVSEPGGGAVIHYRLDGPALSEDVISYDLSDRMGAEKAFASALEWLRANKSGGH